jgi:hypothetical protein
MQLTNSYEQTQGHYDQDRTMVFDLRDDGHWPFGFRPHPALERFLAFATATARGRHAHIVREVSRQDLLDALEEMVDSRIIRFGIKTGQFYLSYIYILISIFYCTRRRKSNKSWHTWNCTEGIYGRYSSGN